MDKIEEFISHLKYQHPKVLKEILDELSFEIFQKANNLKALDDKTCDYITDAIDNYITDNCKHIQEGDIDHEGGDEWVFEDGIYQTELYEIHGFYFYRTPEGETYGLYSSQNEAESESWKH
jgi:hypothetical protein